MNPSDPGLNEGNPIFKIDIDAGKENKFEQTYGSASDYEKDLDIHMSAENPPDIKLLVKKNAY